ncbi:S41 family peptidase [Lachnoanaerobaculum umeaense]|jgi:peptidase, S41 family|uniref:S41 family peptidase n=1 Tax=Lachnoanaerobaculum umeaense TaxID=617123 RepID=A0A385PXN1_9FIRM|nr:S41 family peptidase [Lachnoanaerobaculum umeaense]AYA98726.1 S41 family peptidase [Lachnoanaerobaculum umeaense]PZW99970.1 carboxyl-terminal processing protease [Lachnoanaerobaculum umeaense]
MFEHRENDDFENYIRERQQGRANIDGPRVREERNQKRKGRLSGVIGFILGMMTAFILGYIGFSFALGNGILLSGFTSRRSDKLDYEKIEEKTSYLQSIIDEYFLFDEDMTKVEDGIYAGMMNGLGDPYTVYYTKEEYKALNEDTEGKYSGIGAVVSQNPNTKIITIVNVFDNSPAKESGLQVGDIIYKIDGEEVAGTDMDILVKTKIRGEEGTSFKMTVLRGDERKEVELELTRRSIEVQTVVGKMLDDNIGYIAVSQFDAVTSDQFENSIEELKSQGMTKLIVDLRGNPGGLLDQVVSMLDYILPEGVVLYTEDKYGNGDVYESDGINELKIPMVVLVNENSASASEVFTATFRDFNWGTIVGKTTFGKGIVQNVLPLGDGTAVKITTQHYYPPSGYDLHKVGIKPDVEVDLNEGAVIGSESDNQLSTAIEILKSEK